MFQQQRAWAKRQRIELDPKGYCLKLEDNFFQPLSEDAIQELRSGDGSELGGPNRRGKIRAAHSSSALACNFFDYWRKIDMTPLTRAFGRSDSFCKIVFEQKFPIGVKGKPPNIDVVLQAPDNRILAVESKFTEPFRKSKTKNFLKQKYFPDKRRFWESAGLPGCQRLAGDLRNGYVSFDFLGAAQLLKHLLGLSRNQQSNSSSWQLCYLWFDAADADAKKHEIEVNEFTKLAGLTSSQFQSLTYQELFNRISHLVGSEHSSYISYLRERYFAPSASLV